MFDVEEWAEAAAKRLQMPASPAVALCYKMAAEEDLASFGTAENWAYKKRVYLDHRTRMLANEFFEAYTGSSSEDDDEATYDTE